MGIRLSVNTGLIMDNMHEKVHGTVDRHAGIQSLFLYI